MSKIIKEDCRSISIHKLKEWGYLKGGLQIGGISWKSSWSEKENSVSFVLDLTNSANMWFKLSYTITDSYSGEKHEIEQTYPIVATPCRYGGQRHWFVCSVYNHGRYCGRRVAKLYLGAGSHYFACRHCYNLTYRSRLDGWTYSIPDIEEYEKKIKRWYYRGQPTKKHRRYLKMEESSSRDLIRFVTRLKNKNMV